MQSAQPSFSNAKMVPIAAHPDNPVGSIATAE
jgi:hypothetical protein